MAKRGRKADPEKRTGYFYEEQEQAVVDFMNAETKEERDKIFNEKLLAPFTKMIQSIIRRYRLYTPDEEFENIFNDTLSFLLTKINNFDPTSGYKAYSYCGTICKNYLLLKVNTFIKNQTRYASYEDMSVDIDDKISAVYNNVDNSLSLNSELISGTVDEIQEMLLPENVDDLTENEIKIGNALLDLLTNWEDLFAKMGSNKFNKSSILFFLKEVTLLSTKDIREGMKRYKTLYYKTKSDLID